MKSYTFFGNFHLSVSLSLVSLLAILAFFNYWLSLKKKLIWQHCFVLCLFTTFTFLLGWKQVRFIIDKFLSSFSHPHRSCVFGYLLQNGDWRGSVATSPLALHWVCGSPQAGCAQGAAVYTGCFTIVETKRQLLKPLSMTLFIFLFPDCHKETVNLSIY